MEHMGYSIVQVRIGGGGNADMSLPLNLDWPGSTQSNSGKQVCCLVRGTPQALQLVFRPIKYTAKQSKQTTQHPSQSALSLISLDRMHFESSVGVVSLHGVALLLRHESLTSMCDNLNQHTPAPRLHPSNSFDLRKSSLFTSEHEIQIRHHEVPIQYDEVLKG